MRYDKIFLVSLLLIAIFMTGAVSAAEDSLNNNLTADTNIDDTVSESIDEINEDEQNEEILGSDNADQILSEKQDSGMYLRHDAEYKVDSLEDDEGYWVTVKFPQKVSGNLSCFIDNKYIKDKEITAKTHYFEIKLYEEGLLSYGEHEVEIRYTGDDNYKSAIIKEKFNVTYNFDVSIDNEKNYEATIDVILPYDANGYVAYTINGKKYSAKVTRGSATIKTDLELGNNTIVVSYEDKNYPLKTFTENVFVESKIVGPTGTITYGETEPIIMLKLPADAKGNLHIYTYDDDMDSEESVPITIKKVPLINGEAKYTIEDIHLGENKVFAEYDGTDYELDYEMIWFDVAANLVYQNKMWANATNRILVDMPDGDEADISIHLSYYDYENEEEVYTSIYEGTHKGKFYITLPNLTANSYTLESEINEIEGTDYFEIIKASPDSTLNAKIKYEQDYLSNGIEFEVDPLENADGTVLLYIDGKLNEEMAVTDFNYLIGNLKSITPGIHDVELKFVNDSYYKPTSIKGKISLSYLIVPNSDNIVFGAYVADDATGYLNLIIDGENYDTRFINSITYMNLDNLSYEKHSYLISYSGDDKYPSEQKSGTFENDYYLDIWSDETTFHYGEQYIIIEIPKDGTGCATVSIDGKNPQVFKKFFDTPKADGLLQEITLTDLAVGTHKITLSYSDNKYPLKTIEREFKVLAEYKIIPAYSAEYKSDNDITLILPPNATGNLVVDIEGEKKTVKLVNGKAKYSLNNLTPGYYRITAYYDGNDYEVEPVNMEDYDEGFLVWPNVEVDNYGILNMGEDNTVSIEIQKEAKGKINVKIEKENEDYDYEIVKTSSINLIDGKGSISLSDLKAGDYCVTFEYDGSDLIIPTYHTYITILIPNNITVDFPEKMYSNENPQMIFKSPTDTSGELTVTINEKSTKYSLSNGVITIPLNDLNTGENTEILLEYVGDKTGSNKFVEDVYIEKANPHLNITQTSDSTFGISLEKDATGKIILALSDKTYEAIISNGQATVTIPKLAPGSHKVTVAYSGDSKYASSNAYTMLNIKDNTKIIASNLAMMYNDGSKYSVTVYDADGKLASGVEVTFKVDGKKIGSAKTDSKGVASLKITQVPKTYKISATALGKTVTKKLTVKQILTLKKVTVKKSAKKLVLTATLKKVKGKFLKSKKITFKFNGKTFKAKTDKKGVAKVTIKSSVLKKLKVGKKVTYSATYVKDTVKKSVKVKK